MGLDSCLSSCWLAFTGHWPAAGANKTQDANLRNLRMVENAQVGPRGAIKDAHLSDLGLVTQEMERTAQQSNMDNMPVSRQKSKMDTRLTTQKSKMDNRLATRKSKMDNRLATRKSKMDNRLAAQQSKMDNRLAAQQSKMDNRPVTSRIRRTLFLLCTMIVHSGYGAFTLGKELVGVMKLHFQRGINEENFAGVCQSEPIVQAHVPAISQVRRPTTENATVNFGGADIADEMWPWLQNMSKHHSQRAGSSVNGKSKLSFSDGSS